MADEIVPAGPIKPPASAQAEDRQISPAGEVVAPTASSTAWDMAKSFGSGIARGTTALIGLPGTASDLVDAGLTAAGKKIGIIPESWSAPSKSMLSGSSLEGAMSNLTGGATDYRGKTTAGKYAGTVGEFVPGAAATALTGGTSLIPTVLRGAVAPAIASEFAGQTAEKYMPDSKWAEPAARIAGAILGGNLAEFGEKAVRTAISPGGGANPLALHNANMLRDEGIFVSAGQATGSPLVKSIEANNPTLQAITQASKDSPQMMEFTRASLRMAGLTDDVVDDVMKVATQQGIPVDPTLANSITMDVLGKALGQRFDDALQGVGVRPSNMIYDAAFKAVDDLNPVSTSIESARRSIPTPIVRLVSELDQATKTGTMIDARRIQELRSQLGDYLSSSDPEIVKAAASIRNVLDEAIDASVTAMQQPERMQKLLDVRKQYQNYLAIEKAIKPRQGMSAVGIITPQDLAGAVTMQGRRAMLTGRRDAGNLATAAIDRLGPLPAPTRGFGRSTLAALGEGAGSLMSYPSMLLAGNSFPVISGLATAAAAPVAIAGVADAARRLAIRQLEKYAHLPKVQQYLMNQMVNPNTVPSYTIPALGGAYTSGAVGSQQAHGGRVERKSGGRVGVDHDKLADQLVGAAERAKKGISKGTEQLLDLPDDHIANALAVANRSI